MTATLAVRDLTIELMTRSGPLYPVEQFSLTVEPGEIVGLVGESGSGKTMAMRAVVGLLPKSSARIVSGEVFLNGRDIAHLSAAELCDVRGRDVAMVFQNPNSFLDPLMSVGKQVAEPLAIHRGLTRKEARREVVELFRKVGIRDPERQFDAYPHHFSGGMKQRVMIAAALACNPRLLIADEPTTALDVTIQKQILELLRRLRDETGVAAVLITHDLGVVSELCDKVTVLYAGRIAETAPTSLLLSSPLHPYSRGLIQSHPESARRGEPLPSIPGQPPALAALPSGCRFHPRCGFAVADCRKILPARAPVGSDRTSACLRWGQLAALEHAS